MQYVRLRLFLVIYSAAWVLLTPLILAYFFYRGLKDNDYRKNISERIGLGPSADICVWIHAVSLGELRALEPLIKKLLLKKNKILLTCITPAARRYCVKAYSTEINNRNLNISYMPLDFPIFYKQFFKRFKPKLCLIAEQEIWPMLLFETSRNSIPTFLINSQMTDRGIKKVAWISYLFGHSVKLAEGVFAKSRNSAENFKILGAKNVKVTGEFRFDQEIPENLVKAGKKIKAHSFLQNKQIFIFYSVGLEETGLYIKAINQIISIAKKRNDPKPFFIFVPRAPETFQKIFNLINATKLICERRSDIFDANLNLVCEKRFKSSDVLLGDSFGEMFFYLAIAQTAIAGGGFDKSGAHNIIEPLMLGLRVLVGPYIWTIRFPAAEAMEAGLLTLIEKEESLADEAIRYYNKDMIKKNITGFLNSNSGATDSTISALKKMGYL